MSCRSGTITVSIAHRLKGWPVGPISWLNHFQCGHGHEYQMQPHKFQYIKTWYVVWLIGELERKEKIVSMPCLLQLSGGVGKPRNFWKMTCTKKLNLFIDWLTISLNALLINLIDSLIHSFVIVDLTPRSKDFTLMALTFFTLSLTEIH